FFSNDADGTESIYQAQVALTREEIRRNYDGQTIESDPEPEPAQTVPPPPLPDELQLDPLAIPEAEDPDALAPPQPSDPEDPFGPIDPAIPFDPLVQQDPTVPPEPVQE